MQHIRKMTVDSPGVVISPLIKAGFYAKVNPINRFINSFSVFKPVPNLLTGLTLALKPALIRGDSTTPDWW